jgi:hypothetical protein
MRRPSAKDALRRADRERVGALAPAERVALALELGERSLDSYCRASGVARGAARRDVERRRQARRRRSSCLEALLA